MNCVKLLTPSECDDCDPSQLAVLWQEYSVLSSSGSSLPAGQLSRLNLSVDLVDSAWFMDKSGGILCVMMEYSWLVFLM